MLAMAVDGKTKESFVLLLADLGETDEEIVLFKKVGMMEIKKVFCSMARK